MPITITPADSGASIRIDGEFNIYTAAESRDVLLEALNAHPALTLDIDTIEEIDTAGLQLLLMVQREAKRIGKSLTLSAPSPALAEVSALLNLTELCSAEASA